MKTIFRPLLLVFAAVCVLGAEPVRKGGEFSATASVNTNTGTRSMGFTLAVTNPMAMEDTKPLKEILARGGQQALLNAIRGGGRGKIKLGGFEYPVDLVVDEKTSDGDRFYVVTGRALQYEEVNEGRDSMNHPFSVFVVNVPGFGNGDGRIYTRAALSVDEEGHCPGRAVRRRARHAQGRQADQVGAVSPEGRPRLAERRWSTVILRASGARDPFRGRTVTRKGSLASLEMTKSGPERSRSDDRYSPGTSSVPSLIPSKRIVER